MTRKILILTAALLGLTCGGAVAPDQSMFVLSAAWRGQLLSLGQNFAFGEMTLSLEGETDGAVDVYRGEGTLFGNRFNNRFQQISADYDTTAATIQMTIIDFPRTGAVFRGAFDGTTLALRDTLFCQCEVSLTR